MSAELVHAYEWNTDDIQNFVGLGVGRDEIFLYRFKGNNANGWREAAFDTEDIVRTYDYSAAHPYRIAYGLNSGAIHVRDLGNRVDPLVLKQRTTRKCNAITFSNDTLLASGYEKSRSLDSLLIWDLQSPTLEPIKSVPIHETVAAAKFVPSDPASLLVGANRSLREYDLRSDTFTHTVATNMYMHIVYNPFNDFQFATHGEPSHVALWDRRMMRARGKQTEPLLVVPRAFKDNQKFDTRCFRYSPLNICEVAALNDGAMIRRWQTSETVTRPGAGVNAAPSQLSSGLTQHNRNNSGANNNGQNDDTDDDMLSLSGASESGIEGSVDIAASLAPTRQGSEEVSDGNTWDDEDLARLENTSLFVNMVFEVPTENDKVVSFDYAKNTVTGALEFACLRQSGTVFRMAVRKPPLSIHLDPYNNLRMVSTANELRETSYRGHDRLLSSDLLDAPVRDEDDKLGHGDDISSDTRLRDFSSASHDTNIAPVSPINDENSSDSDDSSSSTNDNSSADTSAESGEDGPACEIYISLPKLLSNDILATMQRRALAGYSVFAAKNIELLQSSILNPTSGVGGASSTSAGLMAAWRWLKQQQQLSETSHNYLDTPELDLRYIGVYALWNGSDEALLPRLGDGYQLNSRTLSDAIRYALRKTSGAVYAKKDDDKGSYRQLCLRLAGWDFSLNELETRISELESKGQYEKAAGWAVFHDNVERAVECLANSRKKNLRLMSTAIAGYLVYKDVSHNNVWREQCRRLASELSVPYLRAIFAYISDGSWLDVLDDSSLPLTERLGIALRFLPQKEVGKYLSLVTSRAIANGDLEGIILTGFTPKVIDLLQAYLDRSGDIQTVCLLVSFGWPRYFDDPRFSRWFFGYRQLLNSWKYFSQRACMDIARSKLFKPRNSAASLIQTQAFLRCNNCKKDFSGSTQDTRVNQTNVKSGASEPRKQLRNRCFYCNHPLPPCGVCTLPLGPCLDDEIESDRWPTFCLRCNHGHHSVHARQWFKKYDVCPMPSCSCKCGKTA